MNWYTQTQINEMVKEAQTSPEWSKLLSTYGVKLILLLASLWGVSPLSIQNAFAKEPQKVVKELDKIKDDNTRNKKTVNNGVEDIASMIARHEGKSYIAYPINGIMHVGIGSNLEREFMPARLAKLGLDYKKVLHKQQKLTEQQVQALFKMDLADAQNDVRVLVPNFSEQPKLVQNILIDMAFNMGAKGTKRGLGSMGTFLSFVNNKNYAAAADAMAKTKWYSQVKNRAVELTNLMKSVK